MSQYNSQVSASPPPFLLAKNRLISKTPPGKISNSIVLVLYTDEHSKTTEKPGVLSFSPWIGCQTHVHVCATRKKNKKIFERQVKDQLLMTIQPCPFCEPHSVSQENILAKMKLENWNESF